MKKVFKFTMAALAATVLASCSTDDFSSFDTEKGQLQKGDLIVEVEGMRDAQTTRAMIVPNGKTGTFYWQYGDKIFVFDESATAFDEYRFEGDKDGFELYGNNNSYLTDVKYAAFGITEGDIEAGMENLWSWRDHKTTLVMRIPKTMKWAEERMGSGEAKQTAYVSNLPMWGTASKEGDKVKASLRYLTGVLRVNMANLPNNANYIYVRGWQGPKEALVAARMTGEFGAVVRWDEYVTDDNKLGIDSLAALDPDYKTYNQGSETGHNRNNENWIRVDVSEAANKDSATVFIPIIAQNYTKLEVAVSRVYASDEAGVKSIMENEANREWYKPVAVNVKRGAYYNIAPELEITGETVYDINEAIAERAEKSKNVNVKVTRPTKVGVGYGETIKLPTDKGVESFNLTLQALRGYSAVGNALKISAPEMEDETERIKITLDVTGEEYTWGIDHIYIDAPNADVIVKGEGLENITLGNLVYSGSTTDPSRFTPNSLNVASLTIANVDEKNTKHTCEYHNNTTVACNYGDCTTTKVYAVYVNANKNLKDVTVAEGAEVRYDLQLERGTNVENLYIYGKVGGNVDASVEQTFWAKEHNGVNVTLGEKYAYIGTLKTNQAEFEIKGTSSVGDAECTGDVTIARRTEGVAVNNLKMNTYYATNNTGAKRNLTLIGGYIKSLKIDRRDGTNGIKTITMNNDETENSKAVPTAFVLNDGDGTIEDHTSVWAGAKINNADFQDPNKIVTAAQLETLKGVETTGAGKTYTVMYDLDMNNKGIKPIQGVNGLVWNCSLTGAKTNRNIKISNLKVTGAGNGKPAGLFGHFVGAENDTKTYGVTNLDFINAQVEGVGESAGILFGKAARNVTVKNVNVAGTVKVTPYTDADGNIVKTDNNVGGVCGEMVSYPGQPAAEKNVLLVEKVNVNCSEIAGRYNLGGLVGKADNIEGKKVTIEAAGFKVTLPSEGMVVPPAIDSESIPEYGSVGKYCGYLNGALNLSENSSHGSDMTLAERVKYGFLLHYKNEHWSSAGAHQPGYEFPDTGNDYYWYGSTGGVIGQNGTGATVNINGRAYQKKADGSWLLAAPEDATVVADLYVFNAAIKSSVYMNDEEASKLIKK